MFFKIFLTKKHFNGEMKKASKSQREERRSQIAIMKKKIDGLETELKIRNGRIKDLQNKKQVLEDKLGWIAEIILGTKFKEMEKHLGQEISKLKKLKEAILSLNGDPNVRTVQEERIIRRIDRLKKEAIKLKKRA